MLEMPTEAMYIGKTIEELLEKRQELIEEIKDYEDKYILYKKPLSRKEIEIVENPSPKVRYLVNNDRLTILSMFIKRKLELEDNYNIDTNNTNDSGDKKYYYVFVEYGDGPSYREYSYISDDTTIKVGDLVLVDRRGEEVEAEVTFTKFYKKKEAPYPVDKTKHVIEVLERYKDKKME